MQNHITRRSLLRLGVGSLGLLGLSGQLGRLGRLGQLNAQVVTPTPDYKALVCVFLFGGNDGNNTVIPIQTGKQGYSAYSATRGPQLSLPQASLAQFAAANGDVYGLHPSLAPLAALYQQRRAAVVANVGTLLRPLTKAQYRAGQVAVPSNLFSHSDQQQQWQTTPGLRTGWGGRAADILQALNAPSSFPTGVSTSGNPVFLAGQNTRPASVTNGGLGLDGSDGSPAANARDESFQQILTFDTGMTLIQTANRFMAEGIQAGKDLNAALSSGGALQTVFPQTGLGSQLQQVAQIMKVRSALGMNRQIFFVSMGGFDTHTNQLPDHISLFNQLAGALTAFDTSIQELGIDGQVVTFTESEFGRTCQPSTGIGSDHAWGSHQLVIGKAIKAPDMYGALPSLQLNGPDDVTGRGVWLPSASLDQYAATLASWFGVPDASLPTVFPNLANFANPKLGFL
jgi:uncharacterized protein (DUF1501 family)